MDQKELYLRAARGMQPLDSKETSERQQEQQELFRQRVAGIFDSAEQHGHTIDRTVVVRRVLDGSQAYATDVTKRMLTVRIPADPEFQYLASAECDELPEGTLPDVEIQITIGVHDLTVYDNNGRAQRVRPAASCDIITSLVVVNPETDTIIQPHSFNDATVLERLNSDYPVFTSDISHFTGASDQQLYPPIDVTPEMEYEASARWGAVGWERAFEGMRGSLDQIERALKVD